MAQDSPLFLSMWNWDPITLAGGILLVAIYLGVEFVYRPKVEASKKVSLPGTACFIAGILIAVLLRVSPLDELSDKYLLIPHMITHLTLSNVIAPLLVLGMPGWWFSRILRIPFWKKAGQGLTAPALAFMLFNINLLGWHYPPIYEAAMANESIHLLEHAAFLVTGLMFWWPILNHTLELPRLSSAYQILYLFLASVPCTILGVVLVFGPLLYPSYINAPRITSLDAATDQAISGILMTTLDNLFYLGVLSVVFFKWLNREDAKSNSAAE